MRGIWLKIKSLYGTDLQLAVGKYCLYLVLLLLSCVTEVEDSWIYLGVFRTDIRGFTSNNRLSAVVTLATEV